MRADRKGFTLIELLVVMVVLGVLSAIAIAKFTNMKEEAYVTAMRADLRNFAVHQMNYMVDTRGLYFSGDGVAQGFNATPGVTVNATFNAGPPADWSATASHANTVRTCTIATGSSETWEINCT